MLAFDMSDVTHCSGGSTITLRVVKSCLHHQPFFISQWILKKFTVHYLLTSLWSAAANYSQKIQILFLKYQKENAVWEPTYVSAILRHILLVDVCKSANPRVPLILAANCQHPQKHRWGILYILGSTVAKTVSTKCTNTNSQVAIVPNECGYEGSTLFAYLFIGD